jgi:hypothetical protein
MIFVSEGGEETVPTNFRCGYFSAAKAPEAMSQISPSIFFVSEGAEEDVHFGA